MDIFEASKYYAAVPESSVNVTKAMLKRSQRALEKDGGIWIQVNREHHLWLGL